VVVVIVDRAFYFSSLIKLDKFNLVKIIYITVQFSFHFTMILVNMWNSLP